MPKGLYLRTPEIRARQSKVAKGQISWAKGLTKETDPRMEARAERWRLNNPMYKAETRQLVSSALKGRPLSLETRKKLSLSCIQTMKSGSRKGNAHWTYYNGRAFRSSWEADFARVLDRVGIYWEYEPPLELVDSFYLIDFYLPEFQLYVEVKGFWRDEASRMKYEEASKRYHTILLMEKELRTLGVFEESSEVLCKSQFVNELHNIRRVQ